MLEDLLGYGNHVGLFVRHSRCCSFTDPRLMIDARLFLQSEEISISGRGLGNTPQGFSAVVRPFCQSSSRLLLVVLTSLFVLACAPARRSSRPSITSTACSTNTSSVLSDAVRH
jgi:hypothetical protein